MTLPNNINYKETIESENLKNLDTQQSFSSCFTANLNYNTSNGSSFLNDERKLLTSQIQRNTIMNSCIYNLNHNNMNGLETNSSVERSDIMTKSYEISNRSSSASVNKFNNASNNNNFIDKTMNGFSRNIYSPYNICQDGFFNNKIFHNFNNINNDNGILDNIALFIKDQNGCRMIQKKFEERNLNFMVKFFEKVIIS